MRRTLMVLLMAAGGCDPEEIEHEGGTDDGGDDPEATFPTRYAEAYCAALFACDPLNTCTETSIPYGSEADCVQGERTALEEAASAAKGAAMSFDADCVERSIAQYEEVGCDGHTRLQVRFGESYGAVGCQPYYGTVPLDEDPCFDVVGTELSTCGANLQCNDEQCEAIGPNGCECPEGQSCGYGDVDNTCKPFLAVGETCILPDFTLTGVCAVDSYCSWNADEQGTLIGPQVCVATAALGEPCLSPLDCASHACQNELCVPASPWLCESRTAPRRWR